MPKGSTFSVSPNLSAARRLACSSLCSHVCMHMLCARGADGGLNICAAPWPASGAVSVLSVRLLVPGWVCLVLFIVLYFPLSVFLPLRRRSQKTANSGSVSKRTATTRTRRWPTEGAGRDGSGTWHLTSAARPRWAPARGSRHSTCPLTSCRASRFTRGSSMGSPSLSVARRPKLHHTGTHLKLLHQRHLSVLDRGRPSLLNTGPSTGLGETHYVLKQD